MSEESFSFLDGAVRLYAGDCLDILDTLDENSIDGCCTDPPYHLHSIVKRFGKEGSAAAKHGADGAFARASRGFMGKRWDGGDIAFRPETWAKVYRVLKPGAYIACFASSRTYHRIASAIEDAGFITHPLIANLCDLDAGLVSFLETLSAEQLAAFVRLMDSTEAGGMLGWIFGQGLPKAHRIIASGLGAIDRLTAGWEGWRYGAQTTKPAIEPIYMGQKPFSEKTGTLNVLRWGTGALNIHGCRIDTDDQLRAGAGKLWSHYREGEASAERRYAEIGGTSFSMLPGPRGGDPDGRWPANVVHDGSDAVLGAFPDAPGQLFHVGPEHGDKPSINCYGDYGARDDFAPRGDSGSAARFFYTAKADADDRAGSKHPTVKPLSLIQWLCRLITPPGGTLIDPFAGTGTTGEAAWREGFNAVLIERDEQYQIDIERRMLLCRAGPLTRAKQLAEAAPRQDDPLPLFADDIPGGAQA